MLNKFLAELGIHKTGMVMGIASNIIKAYETEYAKDQDARLASLDASIFLLQQHRDEVAAAKAKCVEVAPTP